MEHEPSSSTTKPLQDPPSGAVTGLAAEIGKREPFGVMEEAAYLNLVRTHAQLSVRLSALFKAHGISEPLYNILRILAGNAQLHEKRGESDPGLTVTLIAERMVSREPDMTRLIDRLERPGLVRRERSVTDRRCVSVVLTPAGRSVADALRPQLEAVHRSQLGHLSEKEITRLIELLTKARAPTSAPETE